MMNVSYEEIATIAGGTKCIGFWIGTKDLQYGLCYGEFQP